MRRSSPVLWIPRSSVVYEGILEIKPYTASEAGKLQVREMRSDLLLSG